MLGWLQSKAVAVMRTGCAAPDQLLGSARPHDLDEAAILASFVEEAFAEWLRRNLA